MNKKRIRRNGQIFIWDASERGDLASVTPVGQVIWTDYSGHPTERRADAPDGSRVFYDHGKLIEAIVP